MKPVTRYKTWIEINRAALQANVRTFRSILKKGTQLHAVVKSNAYGHGLQVVAQLLDGMGVDGYCIDSVYEGRALRACGIHRPLLVLGPTLPALLKDAAEENVTVSISNFEALRAWEKGKAHVPFHIKIDSGMHRQGFYPEEVPKLLQAIRRAHISADCLQGLFTHFASAKDVTYPDYTKRQITRFKKVVGQFRAAGWKKLYVHAAATGGTVLYPDAHASGVRIGMGLYGYWPSREAKLQHSLILGKELSLRPILSWRAAVSEVKRLKPGDYVGYDCTERVDVPMQAAIIPIGYWHGFPRILSSRGEVLIRGVRGRVMGRVSMDVIVVGFPAATPIYVGDVATFIGHSKKISIDAEKFGEYSETSAYEALTRINPLMQKIIT